jgi:RimJ/RimL family protein N-acetyltransferase
MSPVGHAVAMQSANLLGRRICEDDLPFVTRVWNDERVAATVGGPRTDQQLLDRIAQWIDHWSDHGFGEYLFEERTSSEPVGWGGLQFSTIGIGECLTVGYVLAPSAWGRGYATQIAVVSVGYAFEVLGAEQVFASVLATNAASRRVLEKAGLAVHLEIDHGSHVEVIYITTQ